MIDLLAIGELMWLTTIELTHFLKPGETTPVRRVQRMIGNDAAIVAVMASQMGLTVKLRTNSISENDGQDLIKILLRNQISLDLMNISSNYTPTNYCLIEKDGDRTWLPPCINYFPTLPRFKLNAKYVYLDLYEEAEIDRLSVLSEIVNQKQRIFINLSATSIDHKLGLLAKNFRKKIDILQLSSSQNMRQAQKTAERILTNLSLKAVIITLGKNGSILCTPDGVSIQRNEENIKTFRNMGAGATFSAAFIYGLTKGYTYEEAHKLAVKKAIEFCSAKNDPLQ